MKNLGCATRQFKLLALTGFVLITPYLLSAQSPDQTPSPAVVQAAVAAFPEDLNFAEESPEEDSYSICPKVFSQHADGTPDLIAAAYSGDGAEIAMLAYAPSGASILSTITNQQFLLTLDRCSLQIDNLADPEHPDSPLAKTINVTFGGGPHWFFTWDGNKLKNITALEKDSLPWRGKEVPNTAMYSAKMVDIDHSGPMQFVGDGGGSDKFPDSDGITSTGTFTLFRYNGTTYAAVKTLLSFKQFKPNIPKTTEDLLRFDMSSLDGINMHKTPASSYQLKIVNGDRGGSNRVTSAKIEVNDVTIVLANDINQSVETLTRTIQLQKENDIKVTVDGPAKSHLYVIVE